MTRITLWVAVIVVIAYWIWATAYQLIANNWLAITPAVIFVVFAFLSYPPHIWRTPDSKWPRFSPFRFVPLFIAGLVVCGTFAVPYVVEKSFLAGLPKNVLDSVVNYEPVVSTVAYSADGQEVCRFTLQDRVFVPNESIPLFVKHAFIASEDKTFYQHNGIDLKAIIRAGYENYDSGEIRQGGSTISQQVVKMIVLKDNTKSLVRKVREVLLVVQMERKLSKERILEIYLNHIFLGHGAYGIEAASQTYFGKHVDNLSLAEVAMLAGLPKAPSKFSPFNYFARSKERQHYVLGRMRELGYISEVEKNDAEAEEIMLVDYNEPQNRMSAPYFCEHLKRELKRMYGFDGVYKRGLRVKTTLNMKMQNIAFEAVRKGLVDLERRLGFTGPDGHDADFEGLCRMNGVNVPDGLIAVGKVIFADPKYGVSVCVMGEIFNMHPDDVGRINSWEKREKKKILVGDYFPVRIETFSEQVSRKETQEIRYALSAKRTAGEDHPESLQSALIAVEPYTGYLRAIVGGYDWNEHQFNNATQARRQTGSSVKPYVYLSALINGTVVTDKINDHLVCYSTASGSWCPKNYLGPNTRQQYMGLVDLRTALAKSLNSVSVQLLAKVGVDEVIRTMRAVGIKSPIERVMPIAIGALEVTLWEHTYGYATIASNGMEMPRHPGAEIPGIYILEVSTVDGQVLYKHISSLGKQAVPSGSAYALIHLMKGVIEFGTGRRVQELRRPAAGKTGTTNDFFDTWFMGFTTDLVVGVWVGRKTPSPIAKEATGGSVALPIWLAFMKAAHPDTPPRDFPVPSDVVLVPNGNNFVPFQRGHVPKNLLK
ncbi:MAG: PBP1A family penicillin-binding protein [bacterium]|nr:PBP1A family penicillin-binding protein [bacterium]